MVSTATANLTSSHWANLSAIRLSLHHVPCISGRPPYLTSNKSAVTHFCCNATASRYSCALSVLSQSLTRFLNGLAIWVRFTRTLPCRISAAKLQWSILTILRHIASLLSLYIKLFNFERIFVDKLKGIHFPSLKIQTVRIRLRHYNVCTGLDTYMNIASKHKKCPMHSIGQHCRPD